MSRALIIAGALAALPACKAKSEDAKPAPAAPVAAPAGADPWSNTAKKSTPPSGDPGLARLVELAQDGPGAVKFPQADAVVAEDRDDISLAADGTVTEHHHSIVKLLDAQRGKEKFADVHIPFDTRRQTLTIATARTVNADGTPHVAAPEEIGDIVPSRLADATIYSDVRERVVSFPAVDTGSVVELDYTRTTKPGPDAPLGGEQMLGLWDPIVSRIITISTPLGTSPKLAVEGMTLAPEETTTGDRHTFTFTEKDVPDRQPENGSPVEAIVLPRLVYGFQSDWNKVLQPVADRFLSAAVPSPLPPAIKAEADRIIGDAKTDEAKAQKLFEFVTHDVRTIDLPLGWAGYQPHSPDVVLANRYADVRDKVGLLLALCAAENIAGRPVLVRLNKVPVLDSVPTIAQFDHMLAKLSIGGKDVWLDASEDGGQYGLAGAGQDNLVLPVQRNGAELGKRPALDPSTSSSHTTTKLALAANGDLDAQYTYELTGAYANRATDELRALKGENLTKFFQRGAAGLSASAVDKSHEVGDTMSVTGAFAVAQHVSVPAYSQAQGAFRVFELPPSTLDVASEVPSASLTTRKYPLWIGTPRTESEDVSVQMPAGWKVAYVPPKLEGTADGIAYGAHCEAVGQTVTCHSEVTVNQFQLAPDKYAGFHDAMTKLRAYERRIVLLTKA